MAFEVEVVYLKVCGLIFFFFTKNKIIGFYFFYIYIKNPEELYVMLKIIIFMLSIIKNFNCDIIWLRSVQSLLCLSFSIIW